MPVLSSLAFPAALAVPLALAAAAASAAPLYHLTDLGESRGSQINANGDIAGVTGGQPAIWYGGTWHTVKGSGQTSMNSIGDDRTTTGTSGLGAGRHHHPTAVMWKPDGTQVKLIPNAPPGDASYGNLVGADGTIYGQVWPDRGPTWPFTWKAGTVTPLPYVEGWDWTKPTGVDKAGRIAATAGAFGTDQCPSEAVLFTGGAWMDLGSLGGDCTGANGINDSGVVVGYSTFDDTGVTRAFMWKDGVMTGLPSPGAGQAEALAVNSSGVIVGRSRGPGGYDRAVVWRDGGVKVLARLVDRGPDHLEAAVSINDAGQILATGFDNHDFATHTYLLDPM